ncbi:YkgJ family cysteine cluster protein [Streptomyces sp. M19]
MPELRGQLLPLVQGARHRRRSPAARERYGTAPREFITLREGENSDFRLRPNGPAYDLYLTRRASSGGCVFLMEISETKARCGVYGHRPLVCSNFPMAMTQGMVELRQDTVCGPDSWNLATMDLSRYRRDILANKAAWGAPGAGPRLEQGRRPDPAHDEGGRPLRVPPHHLPEGEEKREGQPDPATAASS